MVKTLIFTVSVNILTVVKICSVHILCSVKLSLQYSNCQHSLTSNSSMAEFPSKLEVQIGM